MARYPVALLAQTFSLSSAHQINITDSDATSPRSKNINSTAATLYFRHFIAADSTATASTATTQALAHKFNSHLQAVLNDGVTGTLWTVASDPVGTGRYKITYGGNGTGTITWDGTSSTSTVPRNLCGFTANISLASGASVTATYQPTYALPVLNRARSPNWQRQPPAGAWATMPDGVVYGYRNSIRHARYQFTMTGHPTSSSLQASLESWGTPVYPDAVARWTTPPTSSAVSASNNPAPPWSYWDFLDTAAGNAIGLYDVAAAGSTYDLVYLDPKCWSADRSTAPTQQGNASLADLTDLTLLLKTKGVSL